MRYFPKIRKRGAGQVDPRRSVANKVIPPLGKGNWNVVQYSALLIMMARTSGLEPGELVHVIADAHIYDRHVPLVKELISREPLPAPKLWLNPEVKNFYDFTVDDVKLLDYETHEQIKGIPVAI